MSDSDILKNILTELINRGRVTGWADLSKKLGQKSVSNLYKMRDGDRELSQPIKDALHRIFSVSYAYMTTGKGRIIEEKNTPPPVGVAEVESLQSKLRELEEKIADKDRLIETQAALIRLLQDRGNKDS